MKEKVIWYLNLTDWELETWRKQVRKTLNVGGVKVWFNLINGEPHYFYMIDRNVFSGVLFELIPPETLTIPKFSSMVHCLY